MPLFRILIFLACCALSRAEDSFKSQSAFGSAFEYSSMIQVVEDWWTHTIQINLPTPIWRDVDLNLCRNLDNKDLCQSIVPIQTQMRQLQARTQKRLDKSYEQILDIFPQQPMFKVKNRAVAPFKYESEITRMFNSITERDIKTLEKHIKDIEKTGEDLKGVHLHDSPFSSINKHQIADIFKLMKSIEQNHADLESYSNYFNNEFYKYSQIVSLLIDVQDKLHTLEDQVEHLYQQLSILKMGKLSPLLVNPEMMREIMKKVEDHLAESFPSFQLAFDNPDYYYNCRDLFYMRHNQNMYITLKFPIINKRSLVHVFKMNTYPLPLDPTGLLPHTTQLVDHAEYLALTEDGNYYALMSSAELSECGGHKLLHCPFPIPLISIKEPSCELAIFNDMTDIVEELCDFRFLMEHAKPTIRELSPTHILVINSTGLTITSPTTRMTHKGCLHCIIEIPCQFSVTSGSFYVAPRITDCRNHTEVRMFFPTNLPVLKHFTDHRAKRELRGDTMLAEPLMFQLPNMDIFNHRYADSMANDKTEHLSLKKVAEASRKGEPVYMNLAERMLNGDIALVQPWWSVSTLWDFSNFALALLSGLFSLFIFFKIRELREFIIPESIAEQHREHKGPVSKMF